MMLSPASRRAFAALIALAACPAAITAQGTPVGFEERYALAKDRAAVVAELIPGTADYYYYHCRERLDARDFETVRKVLPIWIKRHGRNYQVVEIENREALLSYGEDPERTYGFLRERLGVSDAAYCIPHCLDKVLDHSWRQGGSLMPYDVDAGD